MAFFVNHSFDHHFASLLDKLEKKYGTEMFELEGIDKKNLDIAKFTNKFLETTTTADISVDANANVDDTSILSWDYEMPKALMKLNGLYFLWKDALKKYGIKRANKMIELEIAGGIRIHDLHAWLKPYCWGTSLASIVNEGMPWVKRIKIGPVKHFQSFINNTFQLICTLSTQCAGAVAVPDFLIYAEYFIRKDFGDKWYENENNLVIIKQAFQHFIYSVNNSFRGNQSLTYDQQIIVDEQPIQIGEFVEQYLTDGVFEKDISGFNKTTYTLNRQTGKHESKRIKGVIKHKTNNKLVKYTLKNKQSVVSTDNHSFFTRNGLDIIEVQRNNNPKNLLIPFNFLNDIEKDERTLTVYDFNGKKGTDDIVLDERWMYLLGQYLGDGSIYGSTLYLTTYNANHSKIIADMFPEYSWVYNSSDHKSLNLNVGKNITNSIVQEFGSGSRGKNIDRSWATHKNILHLIGGYIDSDGCSAKGQRGFVITSVNKLLLNSIQYILAGYGILSSLKTENRKGFNNRIFEVNTLRISAKGSRILNNYTKFKKFDRNINNRNPERLFVDLDNIMLSVYQETGLNNKIFKSILSTKSYISNSLNITEIDAVCNKLIECGFKNIADKLNKFKYCLPMRVVSIDEEPYQEYVYDISVEDNENFLTANNIYAHNSPFTNVSVYDKYWLKSLFSNHMNPDFTHPDLDNAMRVQKIFVEELINQLQDNPFTFPVMTAASLIDPETREYKDQEWLDWLCEVSVKNKCLNFFQDDSTSSISSCCRLKNELTTTGKDGKQEYVNSFGVGGISIGSHRVVCINLPQIAYIAKYSDKNDWQAFFNILESRIKVAQDILDIHKELLARLIKNGNLPMYTFGVMDLNKQYSTLGFIGLYECLEIMGLDIRTEEGLAQGKKILGVFNKLNAERSAKDGRIRNLEQIPGESAAVTFCLKDKLQFANTNDYDLYANQYLPLIKEALLTDRIRLQGEFDKGTSGGAILHADFDQEISKEQIKGILNSFAKNGVIYGAIDDAQIQCKNCGKVTVGPPNTTESPCCKSPVEIWMRVVGFKTPKRSYNKVRRTKDLPRRFCYQDGPMS